MDNANSLWSLDAIPFSFIVFYAGLQTVPKDQIESARIDGASKFQEIIYITLPHLMPLITFVTLIQLWTILECLNQ